MNTEKQYRLLLRVAKGLGDCLQLGCVIKHLKHYHPDWFIGVECREPLVGAFEGVADAVHLLAQGDYRKTYDRRMLMPFERPSQYYDGVPSTKVAECLNRYFPECKPIKELFHYTVADDSSCQTRMKNFHEQFLEGKPFALLHHEGTNSPEEKNMPTEDAQYIVDFCLAQGWQVLLLDFANTSRLKEQEGLHFVGHGHGLWLGHSWGDARAIKALIERAEVFFGVDSGPEHIAATTKTPTFVWWTGHNPLRCFDLADNVTHWLPDVDRIEYQEPREFFEEHYHHYYYPHDVGIDLDEYFKKETTEPFVPEIAEEAVEESMEKLKDES